jgi:hypothetical protein
MSFTVPGPHPGSHTTRGPHDCSSMLKSDFLKLQRLSWSLFTLFILLETQAFFFFGWVFFFFFFFAVLGFELRALCLLGRLYHLSHFTSTSQAFLMLPLT